MFLLAFVKTDSDESIKFLYWLSFTLIGQFSLVSIHGCLSEQFSGSQAAFRTIFRVTGVYFKTETSFLTEVNGRIFTISTVIDFKETRINFILDVHHKKTAKKCKNRQSS